MSSRELTPLPEAGNDPADPNRPVSEEGDSPAPVGDSNLDLDDLDNQETAKGADDDESDNESELSDVDEAEFDEFDPASVAIDTSKPNVHIDEDIAKTLKAGKRKRSEKDGEGRKAKEGKREKKKKRRDEDEDPGGVELDGKRIRKPKSIRADGERRERPKERRAATPENEDNLSPEERRVRALDRAMDAALKNPNKRRRKKDEVVSIGQHGSSFTSLTCSRISKKHSTRRLQTSNFEWSRLVLQITLHVRRINPLFTSSSYFQRLWLY